MIKNHHRQARTIAASLRSLAGHLYREARTMEPADGKNAYASGLREAALIASRRASRFEEPARLERRKIRAAKKK